MGYPDTLLTQDTPKNCPDYRWTRKESVLPLIYLFPVAPRRSPSLWSLQLSMEQDNVEKQGLCWIKRAYS